VGVDLFQGRLQPIYLYRIQKQPIDPQAADLDVDVLFHIDFLLSSEQVFLEVITPLILDRELITDLLPHHVLMLPEL